MQNAKKKYNFQRIYLMLHTCEVKNIQDFCDFIDSVASVMPNSNNFAMQR